MRQRNHRRWGGLLTEEARIAIGVALTVGLYTVTVVMITAALLAA